MTAIHPSRYRAPRTVLLAKLCVTFPVLIYGVDRADYLIHYQFDGIDLVAIGLLIALGPGLAVLALETLLSALVRRSLHPLFVAALAFVAVGQMVTWGLAVTGLPGLALTLVLAALAYRYVSVLPRTSLQATVVWAACLVLPVWLVVGSDLEVLARIPVVPEHPPAVTRPHPVVLVILDAFPMVTLLDEAGNVDGSLYPNFRKLLGTATSYRNATANHGYTNVSIPSLLSGRLPSAVGRNLPLASEHPDNLFNLLSGKYSYRIAEASTRLSPENLPRTERVAASRLERWAAVAYDLMLVLPMSLRGSLNDRQLGDLIQRLRFFGAERARQRDEDVFERTQVFRQFVGGIDGASRESLYYLHVCLPHDPWDHTPDGERYRVPAELQGIRLGMLDAQHLFFYWTDDPWLVRLNYQRLLLQVMHTDRLLGELVDRCKAKGIWDDALVVVTSDHGSACLPNNFPRDCVLPESPAVLSGKTRSNLAEVLAVPLFIKIPGQTTGSVSDRNVELIDLLPTIADVLGITVPWPMDGTSLLKTDAPERPSKTFFDFDFAKVALPRRLTDWNEPIAKRAAWFDPGANGDWVWRVKPLGRWIGQPVPGQARVLNNVSIAYDAQPAGVLSGTVTGPVDGAHLVLSRAGKITAAVRLEEHGRFLTFERPQDRGLGPLEARFMKLP